MHEFLTTALSFPTVVFSAVLGVALLYWLVVIFGALDLDFLDSAFGLDSMEGAIDSALESVEGMADGAVEGAVVEAMEGASEGMEAAVEAVEAAELDADVTETARSSALSGLLHALGVRGVPITIVGSFVLLWAWALSYAGTKLLGPLAATFIVGLFLAFAAVACAILLGALSARPFRRLFTTQQGPRRSSLVGKLCTVTSGRVDASFGQAEIEDGGAGFVAEVRCPQDNDLKRGSKALVYRYDRVEGVFFIGAVDDAIHEAASVVRNNEVET